jgi:hypothetical protein
MHMMKKKEATKQAKQKINASWLLLCGCVVSWELTISPNVLSLSTLDNNTTIFSFVS